jgi:hypothetical protein
LRFGTREECVEGGLDRGARLRIEAWMEPISDLPGELRVLALLGSNATEH